MTTSITWTRPNITIPWFHFAWSAEDSSYYSDTYGVTGKRTVIGAGHPDGLSRTLNYSFDTPESEIAFNTDPKVLSILARRAEYNLANGIIQTE